jgi:hypothetical protein
MKRSLSLIRGLPKRDLPARRLAVLLFLGALGFLGARLFPANSGLVSKPSNPQPDKTPTTSLFSGLRPKAGDHMTLPRLGFRWSFEMTPGSPRGVSQASIMPRFRSSSDSSNGTGTRGNIRYVLHLVGPGGQPEITKESSEPELRVNLKKDFPPGDCEWWVEALIPGQPPVASEREKFTLSK